MKTHSHAIDIHIADKDQIPEFQKMLYQIYCVDLKWHDPAEFPDGIFRDSYDAVSSFLTIYKEGKLIAGVRLVPDSAYGFPHEKVSFITLPYLSHPAIDQQVKDKIVTAGRKKIFEVTRFIADRTTKRIHTYDLMKAMYWFALSRNIEIYFFIVDMSVFLTCQKLGFDFIPIGIPIFCEGSWTIPAVMIVNEMIPEKENVRKIFLDPSNLGKEFNLTAGNC